MIPWTAACQAPLSMRFSRQEYQSGLPCLLQVIFLTRGLNLCLLILLHWQEFLLLLLLFLTASTTCEALHHIQFSSVAQSCPTLCNPMQHSTPGLPVHHQLPEFTQTHVHWYYGVAISKSTSQAFHKNRFECCKKVCLKRQKVEEGGWHCSRFKEKKQTF